MSSMALFVYNGTYLADDEILAELNGSSLAVTIWQIRQSFADLSYGVVLFTLLAFFAYVYLIPRVRKHNKITGVVFSIIAAGFILLCESYYKINSWNYVLGSKTAFLTSCIKGVGIATLAFFAFDVVSRVSIEINKENAAYKKGLFIKLLVVMLICWIPYMIILAPGAMGTDTRDQFGQFLGVESMCWTVKDGSEVLINNHHPVFHTMLLGLFLKIGSKLLGSYFAGMELYCIIQSIVFAAVLTLSVLKIKSYGAPKTITRLSYIFFALCPIFPLWGMATFKDTPFSIALVLTIIYLYDSIKFPKEFTKKKYFALMAILLLLMLVRNNGFYMVLGLVPFVVINTIKDPKFLVRITSALLIPIIIFKVGYSGVLFGALGIEEGSPAEMLSVPFQQTARYVQEYEDEVTDEEKEVILNTLGDGENLSSVADLYVPDRSDSVKYSYRLDKNDTEHLKEYIKVWVAQLTKHPAVYIEAFLNLNFSWFGLDSNHDVVYYDGVRDKSIPEYLEGLDNPESLSGERAVVNQMVKTLDGIPLVNCIFEFSFYSWAYVALFVIMLMKGKHKELLACLPIYINYAICFVGPVAYMRYAIPMVCCLPFVIFITFSRDRKNKDDMKNLEENEIWIK